MLVVFTDLDGTLLEEDGSLSKDARAALGTLRTRGVRVVPLTSKTRLELARWLEELGGERWGAFENGAGLMTPSGIEILPGVEMQKQLDRSFRRIEKAQGAAREKALPGCIVVQWVWMM